MNDDHDRPARRTGGRPLRPPIRIPGQTHSGTVSRSTIRPRRRDPAAGNWLMLVAAAVAATVAGVWVLGATDDATTGNATVTARAAVADTSDPNRPTSEAPAFGPTGGPAATSEGTTSQLEPEGTGPAPRSSPEPTFGATAEPPSDATVAPLPTGSAEDGLPAEEAPTDGPPIRLVIDAPVDGQVVDDPFVVVVGRAPGDAPITRDISWWFDEHTVASPAGAWTMRVGLAPGDNELRFRIGDDATTARTIHVIFEPRT